jgi:hypothetical protein
LWFHPPRPPPPQSPAPPPPPARGATPRRAMVAAGALLTITGLFGVLNTIGTVPAYWQGWLGWIRPLEAAAFAIANLALGVMLVKGRTQVMPWAAVWTVLCFLISLQALFRWGFLPLLGGDAPAFSPLSAFCCDPLPIQISISNSLRQLAPGISLWFVPPALIYGLATLLLVGLCTAPFFC